MDFGINVPSTRQWAIRAGPVLASGIGFLFPDPYRSLPVSLSLNHARFRVSLADPSARTPTAIAEESIVD